jgi:hypothetical protein
MTGALMLAEQWPVLGIEVGDETAQVHHASWWRGGKLDGQGARAVAGRDVADRCAHRIHPLGIALVQPTAAQKKAPEAAQGEISASSSWAC